MRRLSLSVLVGHSARRLSTHVACAAAALFAVAVVLLAGNAESARAQASATATVTRVIDGDTIDALLADGRTVRVRLIGIDTSERGECGTDEATAYMEEEALGRSVNLVGDPTQDAVDRYGRSLFYVDRDDGLDIGQEMIRAGWAEVFVFYRDFQRLAPYRDAASDAEGSERGVWASCHGDFHFSRTDELRERQLAAVAFVRDYYRLISRRRFVTAWGMLAPRQRRRFGPFRRWKEGHRRTLGVSVLSSRARLSGRRAVVSIRIRSRDRDACSGRAVSQYFRGRWVLSPRRDSWVGVRVRLRKTRGGQVRSSKSDCPRAKPRPPAAPPASCQGYSPCLRPGADVDCAGGSGDGPRYVDGPVTVTGSDPYGLDSDGDGVACE